MGRLSAYVILAVAVIGLTACSEQADPYRVLPQYETFVDFGDLEPSRLQVRGDTLYVSYNGLSRIDAYNFQLQRLSSLELKAPEQILPTAFAITDTSIIVADHGRGVVAIFDRQGHYRTSFDTLPDGTTKIQPIALVALQGVAYVADMTSRRVLAISLNDIPDITEAGELILTIPPTGSAALGFPSAVQVTPDGRLLIGDAARAEIAVFACEGSRIYGFESIPDLPRLAPQGFAYDRVLDATRQDESSFDPSGVRAQGRLHLVDGYNGKIHMFTPLGVFIGSYPPENRLAGPTGIAADATGEHLFIADPPTRRILVYRTKGD
jgi:sugar lactone lactonase YvrE